MTVLVTATTTAPATTTGGRAPATRESARVPADALSPFVEAVTSACAGLDLDDDRWATVGPRLTAVVDALRRALGEPGSPIAPTDDVAAVLRLRDLALVPLPRSRAPGTAVPISAVQALAPRVESLQRAISG